MSAGPIYAFAVRVAGMPYETIVNARTAGKAKVQRYHDLDGDFEYTSLRARKIGPAHTSEQFLRNARYRGMPNVRCGQRVLVDGSFGVIVGHNDSANFDVLFDDDSEFRGQTLNVHPSEIKLAGSTTPRTGDADA